MGRHSVEMPVEYVVSEMQMVEREATARGVIVTPRFEGDDDSRFEGESGHLVVAILNSHSTRIAAYDHAIAYFEELRHEELLKEQLLRTTKPKKRRRKGGKS